MGKDLERCLPQPNETGGVGCLPAGLVRPVRYNAAVLSFEFRLQANWPDPAL